MSSKRARRLAAGLFPLQVEMLENRLLLSAAATSTLLTPSNDPITVGQVVALTANISSPGGSPDGGTVTFMDGITLIGTAAVDPTTDQAVGFTGSLTQGTHNITAIYVGTADFAGSTSSAVTEIVNASPEVNPDANIGTTTALTSTQSPINQGQVVALIATVAPASGSTQPTGTVTFMDGATLIGISSVNSTTGVAVAFTASLAAGSRSITATYNGATGFSASTSSTLTEVVSSNANTTTTEVASANPIAQGQLLAITVTVTGGVTTGSVTFNDGATAIGTAAIDPTSGQAVGFWNTLAAGTHNITATYSGSPGFAASTSTNLSLVINQSVATTTTFVPSSNPTVVAQVIALTATVSGAGGIPTGNVTFNDGSTIIGTVAVDATGHAVGFTAFQTAGMHNVTAVYSGDSGFGASTSVASAVTVNPVGADTTTSLAITPSPGLAGQAVALIATVTSVSGSPNGTVTFTDGSTLIGTVSVNSTTHQAIGFSTSLPVGSNSITATYNGSASFAGSVSSAVNETVNPVGTLTTTSLVASSHALVFGQVVALTATVTSTGGNPAGTVNFLDGTALIGSVAINSLTQQAVGYTGGLTPGMHDITAVYVGAGGFATSTSTDTHITVNSDATATTLTTSANNVQVGTLLRLTATVTALAPGGGVPLGSVTFEDGSTLIGTVQLTPASSLAPNTNTAVAGVNALTPGNHSITAIYTPSTGYSASTSSVFTETIIGIPTTTTVIASAASVTMGQNVTFTATVTGSGNMPSGTVTFTSGSTTLGTGTLDNTGKAVVTEYNLNAGTYPVTATYNGDGTHATSVSSGAGSASFAVTTPTFTTNSVNGSSYQTATAQVGNGVQVKAGDVISAEYTLYLPNGTLSQTNVGSTPFQVAVGEGNLVPGFDAGVIGIEVGEVRVLVLQSLAGYGANPPPGSGIPTDAVLTFIVKLVGVGLPRLTVSEGPSGATPVAVTNGQTPSAATGTDFGTSTVGLSTAPSTFTFGDADATLGFTLTSTHSPIVQILGADPGDFVVTQPAGLINQNPQTGAVTAAGTFTIAFLPTAKGVRTATIVISTNDSDVKDFTFTVQGIGV